MVMEGLRFAGLANTTIADILGLGKPKATGLAGDYAKLVLIDDIDELSEKDHMLTTVLTCPPDKCQKIRQRLAELSEPAEIQIPFWDPES